MYYTGKLDLEVRSHGIGAVESFVATGTLPHPVG